MVGDYYPLRLIKRGLSPPNLAVLYTTHTFGNSGVLYLQDKIAI